MMPQNARHKHSPSGVGSSTPLRESVQAPFSGVGSSTPSGVGSSSRRDASTQNDGSTQNDASTSPISFPTNASPVQTPIVDGLAQTLEEMPHTPQGSVQDASGTSTPNKHPSTMGCLGGRFKTLRHKHSPFRSRFKHPSLMGCLKTLRHKHLSNTHQRWVASKRFGSSTPFRGRFKTLRHKHSHKHPSTMSCLRGRFKHSHHLRCLVRQNLITQSYPQSFIIPARNTPSSQVPQINTPSPNKENTQQIVAYTPPFTLTNDNKCKIIQCVFKDEDVSTQDVLDTLDDQQLDRLGLDKTACTTQEPDESMSLY